MIGLFERRLLLSNFVPVYLVSVQINTEYTIRKGQIW